MESVNPKCPLCHQTYDDRKIPKILDCGHTVCLECITKLYNLKREETYFADGRTDTSVKCPLCNNSTQMPTGPAAMKTNHQLFENLNPEMVICQECQCVGLEKSFHICRECTIEKNEYDIHSFLDYNPDYKMEDFAICAECILKKHNDKNHTVVDFTPIRIEWQYKRYILSMNLAQKGIDLVFGKLRTELLTFAKNIEDSETGINQMGNLLKVCKSSFEQAKFANQYGIEAKELLEELEETFHNIRNSNRTLTIRLTKLHQKIKFIKMHCHEEQPNFVKILKINQIKLFEGAETFVGVVVLPSICFLADLLSKIWKFLMDNTPKMKLFVEKLYSMIATAAFVIMLVYHN